MSMTTPIFLAPAAAVAALTAHPVVQPLPDTDPASEIQEERIEPQAEESPCVAEAAACVDLTQGIAWLQDREGHTVYGPVPASGGAPGQDTPTGVQIVSRQVEDEWSKPFNAPMPHATYFGPDGRDNGIAFHADQVGVPSAGCVHLNYDDARAFFEHLQPGDVVHVI